MATTLIANGALCGAMGAILSQRPVGSAIPTDYAATKNTAVAIKDQILVANAALTVPMADADNTDIGQLVESVTSEVLQGQSLTSVTAAHYAESASKIVAACKEAVASLV